jgi:CheY-like chemotaxis protein
MTPTAGQLGRALRVLVVEDYADCADSLADILRLDGCDVQIVREGPVACTIPMTALPDVVVLDIGLPGCDGHEVARCFREQGVTKPRPLLVAVTGYASDTDRVRSSAAGIDLHFAKPIGPEVLLSLLRRFAAMRLERGEGH